MAEEHSLTKCEVKSIQDKFHSFTNALNSEELKEHQAALSVVQDLLSKAELWEEERQRRKEDILTKKSNEVLDECFRKFDDIAKQYYYDNQAQTSYTVPIKLLDLFFLHYYEWCKKHTIEMQSVITCGFAGLANQSRYKAFREYAKEHFSKILATDFHRDRIDMSRRQIDDDMLVAILGIAFFESISEWNIPEYHREQEINETISKMR